MVHRRRRLHAAASAAPRDLELVGGRGRSIGAARIEKHDCVGGAVGDASVVDRSRRRSGRRGRADGGVTDLVVGNNQQRRVNVG